MLLTMRHCCGAVPVHLFFCALFLKQSRCISWFCWSLTSVHVWSVLIKSNKHRPWPLNECQIKRRGNRWEIWEGWLHVGRSGSCGVPWAPSRFASSAFIDLNLMKNCVLVTETNARRDLGWGETDRQLPQIEAEERVLPNQCEGTDITITPVTRGGRTRGSKAPVGVAVTLGPQGQLIWLPGKPPSIADRESHWGGSCPAMTDGETNGLWNSISCEIHSEGGAASRITESCQCYTLGQGQAEQMASCCFREPQITWLIKRHPEVILRLHNYLCPDSLFL